MAEKQVSAVTLLGWIVILMSGLIFFAKGDTSIVAGTQDSFTAHCVSLSGQNFEDFGLWTMSAGGLNHLSFPVGASISQTDCHFAYTENGSPVYQAFPVYPPSLTSSHCSPDSCQWTVESAGIYYRDINTNLPHLTFEWMAGVDPWIPPQ